MQKSGRSIRRLRFIQNVRHGVDVDCRNVWGGAKQENQAIIGLKHSRVRHETSRGVGEKAEKLGGGGKQGGG